MMEVLGENVFRAYFLLVISCLSSTKEYIFTDSSGIIGSPNSHENGQFTYKVSVTTGPDVTIRVQSEKLSLSKRVHGMGCDKNYITVARTRHEVNLPRYCDEDDIDVTVNGPIYITFTKVTDSRTYFNISYKACSYISSDPVGTFVFEDDFDVLSWCFFKINISTSFIVTIFGDQEYSYWRIYGPDDSLIKYGRPCWTFTETYFMRNGPVSLYTIPSRLSRPGSRNGKTLIAKYTTVSEDYLREEYTAPEGEFGPLLFYNRYANDANYTFIIRPDYGGKVLVYFQNTDIEGCIDVIRVNGVVLCQNNATTVTISDTVAKVSFATNAFYSWTGFEGYWTTCGGRYADQFGSIHEPVLYNILQHTFLQNKLSCTYNVKIQYAEYIYLKMDKTSLDVIHIEDVGNTVSNGVYGGNQVLFEYTTTTEDLSPFQVNYLGCPRIFEIEAGKFSLDSPWNMLIPVGFNCSFIIRCTGNETMLLYVNVQFEQESKMTDFKGFPDVVQVAFQDENYKSVTERITDAGKKTFRYFGECIITYIAGDGVKLKFHASFKSQNEYEGRNELNELNESKDMLTLWLVLAFFPVALLLMLLMFLMQPSTSSLQIYFEGIK